MLLVPARGSSKDYDITDEVGIAFAVLVVVVLLVLVLVLVLVLLLVVPEVVCDADGEAFVAGVAD